MQTSLSMLCTHPLMSLHAFVKPQQPHAASSPIPLHRRRLRRPGHAEQRHHRARRVHLARCVGGDAGGAGEIEHPAAEELAAASAAAASNSASAADRLFGTSLRQRTRRMQALDAYREQMQLDNEDIDVLECALLIARHAHPELNGAACRQEIDTLAAGVLQALPEQPVPLRVVQAINQHLYSVRGFRGNNQDYYDPDNSCINMVLENRTGIPITLALLYSAVADRCGLPMVGINLPGHFMLAPAAEDIEILVDAFNGGEVCFLQDAADKLASIHGVEPGMVVIDPRVVHNKAKNAVPPRKFLGRMLHNLKQIYIGRREPHNTLAIIRYLRATLPELTDEIRDEGLCLYALERYSECAEALREYLEADPRAGDRADVESMLNRMQRQELEEPPDSVLPPPE